MFMSNAILALRHKLIILWHRRTHHDCPGGDGIIFMYNHLCKKLR